MGGSEAKYLASMCYANHRGVERIHPFSAIPAPKSVCGNRLPT